MMRRVGRHRNLPFSRARPKSTFNFEDYIAKRDYVGALAILDFGQEAAGQLSQVDKLLWIGYCAFRLGDYHRSKDVYLEILSGRLGEDGVPLETGLYLSCCYFYLQMYDEAEDAALAVEGNYELKTRILLHIACKINDGGKVEKYRQQLHDSKEDKMSAAAVEFSFRHRFQDTADTYKRILVEDKDDLALNVYVAQCYFKLDYYDVSLEVLSIYCQAYPDSTITTNLKACNMFRLCNGKAALEVLDAHCNEKAKEESDLIRHNIVVFNEGEKALQVFPPLVDHIPEARLNLAIYYLKHGEYEAAAELMEDMEPTCPHDNIVMAIINTHIAHTQGTPNALEKAQKHFELVGNSPSECDTIPGRQCMSSFLYLSNQFDDAIVYLESIKAYLGEDDDFNWNYGIALAAGGKYEDGLESLNRVANYRSELAFVLWMAKCYIFNQSPDKAWECYLNADNADVSYEILQLIANECYKVGEDQFLYSARAFDELIKVDSFPEYLEGLIGACVGYFRHLLMKRHTTGESRWCEEDSENLLEVLDTLESSSSPQCRKAAKTIRTWTVQNQSLFNEDD